MTPCARSPSVIGRRPSGSARNSFATACAMARPASYRRTAAVLHIEAGGPGTRRPAGRRRAAIRRGPCGTSSDTLLEGGIGMARSVQENTRRQGGVRFAARSRPAAGARCRGATASVFATGKGLPPPRSKLRRLVPLPPLEDATTPPSPLNVAGRQLAFHDSRGERRTVDDGLVGRSTALDHRRWKAPCLDC